MSLFATKPLSRILAESEEGDHKLKRTLTATQLTALGIGAIIGAGLFSLTGPAAANHAGPAIMLSFVVAAIGCAFAAQELDAVPAGDYDARLDAIVTEQGVIRCKDV